MTCRKDLIHILVQYETRQDGLLRGQAEAEIHQASSKRAALVPGRELDRHAKCDAGEISFLGGQERLGRQDRIGQSIGAICSLEHSLATS